MTSNLNFTFSKYLIIFVIISKLSHPNVLQFEDIGHLSLNDEKNISFCTGLLAGTKEMLNFMLDSVDKDLTEIFPYSVYMSVYNYQSEISSYSNYYSNQLSSLHIKNCDSNCKELIYLNFSKGWDFAIDKLLLIYDEDLVYSSREDNIFNHMDKMVDSCSSKITYPKHQFKELYTYERN